MTLVAAFVAEDFAVMAGDYRRTNMDDHSEYYDDCPKAFKLNDGLLIGHSGDYEAANYLIDAVKQYIKPSKSLEHVTGVFREGIKQAFDDDVDFVFHLAGRQANGGLALARVGQFDSFEPVYIDAQPGAVMFDVSYAKYDPCQWLKEQIPNLTRLEPYFVRRLARRAIRHVASKDEFVSPKGDVVSI